MVKQTKLCINCKKEFNKTASTSRKKWSKQRFCSKECFYGYAWETKVCPVCSKDFVSRKKQHKIHCSILCANRSRPDRGGSVTLKCKNCGNSFKKKLAETLSGNPQFCCKKCFTEFGNVNLRGEKHWNWTGGKSRKNHRRETKEYKEWRLDVYKRDHYSCQDCGIHCNSKEIVAHHLMSYNDFTELRFNIDNGITLCRSCHKKRHIQIDRIAPLDIADLVASATYDFKIG